MGKKLIWFYLILIAAIVAATVVGRAHADSMTLQTPDGVTVVLTDSPCPTEILKNIKDEYQLMFRRARATFDSQTVDLCWIAHEDNAVLIDAQGFGMAVPLAGFMKTSVVRNPSASI